MDNAFDPVFVAKASDINLCMRIIFLLRSLP